MVMYHQLTLQTLIWFLPTWHKDSMISRILNALCKDTKKYIAVNEANILWQPDISANMACIKSRPNDNIN